MLHIAIIGAGGIASAHAEAFLRFPEKCTITAVCNRHLDKASKLIEKYSLQNSAKAFSDLASALAEQHIDAVSICLPPDCHPKESIFAMEHGLDVLVEKPMANSLEECDQMIEAAARTGRKLSVVCQLRFTKQAQKLRTLLSQNTFGQLRFADVDSLWYRGTHYHDIYWRGTWAGEGGGVLTAQAIHHVDLLQYLIGMPDRVTAVMANLGHDNTECEDHISAVWEYDRGCTAQFTASLITHDQRQCLRFYTDQACFSFPWTLRVSGAAPNGYPVDVPEKERELQNIYESLPPEHSFSAEQHVGQVENFLNAILGIEELLSDGFEGRKPVEINTAIYKAAALRTPVSLPITKEDPFYTADGKAANLPHFHEKTYSVENLDGDIVIQGGL